MERRMSKHRMMAKRTVPWRRRGMTLTEVVVGSVLLVVAIVPILKALTIAQSTASTIERRTRSLLLAQARLEEIRAASIHHYEDSFQETSADLADSYRCNVTDDQNPKLRLVTVSVGQDIDADGQLEPEEVEIRLASYLARLH
jgi:Tfp pilus assembly protein PilV